MVKNFIKTSDLETAELLRKEGFYEIKQPQSNVFCFVNKVDNKVLFSKKDKIMYTDVLCF